MHTTHRTAAFVSTLAIAISALTGCATGVDSDDAAFGEVDASEADAPETQVERLLVAHVDLDLELDGGAPFGGPMPIVPRPVAGDRDDHASHRFPSLCADGFCATPAAVDLTRALDGLFADHSALIVVPGLGDVPELDLERIEIISTAPTATWDSPVLVVDADVYEALLARGCDAIACGVEGLPFVNTVPVTDALVDELLFDRADLAIDGARTGDAMIPAHDLFPESLDDDFLAGG